MSHVRKDTLTKPKEWAKHLRPFGKKEQAGRERRAGQKQIRDEIKTPDSSDNP